MQMQMTVHSVTAERNEHGETQSELVAFTIDGDAAFLRIVIKDKDQFSKIHPKQKWTLTIDPVPVESMEPVESVEP